MSFLISFQDFNKNAFPVGIVNSVRDTVQGETQQKTLISVGDKKETATAEMSKRTTSTARHSTG